MSDSSFITRYRDRLRQYVQDPSERQLKAAYELGRAAVQSNLSILDVASAHTRAVISIAASCEPTDLLDRIEAAGDFLVESLASFEMVQRGVTEARRTAFEERRRARMLRELSSVLADPTVVFSAPEAVGELAQLIAEITCEVTGATQAKVTLHTPWSSRDVTATAEGPDGESWSELLRTPDERAGNGDETPREVVKETLLTLDGRPVGVLEVSAAAADRFREDDRATVTQIAQMAAAWLERAQHDHS